MRLFGNVLLFFHLLGFAALFGGAAVQIRDAAKVVNAGMLYGVITQLVTGLLLVGVLEGQPNPPSHVQEGIKLAVALVIAVLCWANRRQASIPGGLFWGITGLTVANVAVAVFGL